MHEGSVRALRLNCSLAVKKKGKKKVCHAASYPYLKRWESITCCKTSNFCITGGSCHKYYFVATNTCCLPRKYACRSNNNKNSRQNYVCRDKIFLSGQSFCCDKYLPRQIRAYFCRDKRRVLSRQTRDNSLVVTKKILVAARTL